jgi:hypothetical protein
MSRYLHVVERQQRRVLDAFAARHLSRVGAPAVQHVLVLLVRVVQDRDEDVERDHEHAAHVHVEEQRADKPVGLVQGSVVQAREDAAEELHEAEPQRAVLRDVRREGEVALLAEPHEDNQDDQEEERDDAPGALEQLQHEGHGVGPLQVLEALDPHQQRHERVERALHLQNLRSRAQTERTRV